jgi:hypothetical protein
MTSCVAKEPSMTSFAFADLYRQRRTDVRSRHQKITKKFVFTERPALPVSCARQADISRRSTSKEAAIG